MDQKENNLFVLYHQRFSKFMAAEKKSFKNRPLLLNQAFKMEPTFTPLTISSGSYIFLKNMFLLRLGGNVFIS